MAIHRRRQAVSPAGELTEEDAAIVVDTVDPDAFASPRRRGRLHRPAPPLGARDARVRRLHDRDAARLRDDHAPRLRALSRADEHLRRPRQHRGPARPLRVARHRLRARIGHRGRAAGPGRPRPVLHGRWPGPGPDRRGRGHGRHQARRPARRRRPRRRRAGRVRRLPAARPQLPAGRRGAARRRARGPAHRARARPPADRQLRDRGRPGHRPAHDRRVREPWRAHLPGRQLPGPRPRAGRPRQQRLRRASRACTSET